jgi:hypothetical protein
MSDGVKPLFPDDLEHRFTCWNCGASAPRVIGFSYSFMCTCGCGWTIRYGMYAELEASQKKFREHNIAVRCKIHLVDFTKPGALSSPA